MVPQTEWKTVSKVGDKPRIDVYWPGKSSERTEGMAVIGKYLGTTEYVRPDQTKEVLYLVQDNSGKVIGINDHFMIANALEQIPEGKTVRVSYLGKKASKNGRQMNTFQVDVASDVNTGEML